MEKNNIFYYFIAGSILNDINLASIPLLAVGFMSQSRISNNGPRFLSSTIKL